MAWPARDSGRTPVIILDTNVLSAMMRAADDTTVEHWFDAQATESVWTTTVTVFEIRFGLALLAAGRRGDRLDRAFLRAINDVLGGRVLSFDRGAAEVAAMLAARQRQIGHTVEIRDVQIAGIAAARRATLATRNTRHFEHLGIALVDPWQA
jgi:predicted nucleic acid-binding protein